MAVSVQKPIMIGGDLLLVIHILINNYNMRELWG